MSDTKLKLKDLGTIHLMALDSTSLFLPFGRPISEYLRGEAGNQNGSRAFLNRGAIDFSPVDPLGGIHRLLVADDRIWRTRAGRTG